MTTHDPNPSKTAARAILRLSRLAADVDEAVCELEEAALSDGQLAYLDFPVLYLTSCVARAGQLVYESQKLDRRPLNERRAAA